MSGGPYGRGKAPERACLKPKDWPDDDRQIWEQACQPADILSLDAGLRANHAQISNKPSIKMCPVRPVNLSHTDQHQYASRLHI